MGLADIFRRDKVQDPFGGDDGFDGESRFAGQGPKIALIASGVLFLLLVGGVAAVVMTGDEAATTQTVGGNFADLQVVDETGTPVPAVEAGAPAAPGAAAPVVADTTAATDRSVERRPWLNAANTAAPATGARPGMDAKPAAAPAAPPAAKPLMTPSAPPVAVAAAAPAAKVEPAKVDAKAPAAPMTPPPAAPAKAPVAAPPTQIAAQPAAKPADTKMAAMAPPGPAAGTPVTAPLLPVSLPKPGATPTPAAIEPEAMPDPARDIAGIPALRESAEAPGAPRHFDAAVGDAGPAVAGGRPRLVEPPLPPTDKIAVASPPPRYANLTDIKKDAPPPAANATSKAAFIVYGLGLSQMATDAAINKLPASVTLAFSPYTRNLKSWVDKAKEKGHEVLIELPMESKEFPAQDPGPLGLLTTAEAKDNQDHLEAIVKESTGAIGVLDTMGSKFRESNEHINAVFTKLKASNLFYVQGEPGVRTGDATVPTALADVVVDERPFRAAIDARLDYAERLAKYQGSVVVAMSAKPVSFERLILWLGQAQKKGVALAPVSQVLIK